MPNTERLKILAADDEPVVRLLLGELFSPVYDIITLDRGDNVIDTILSENINILILDISLPGKTGLEILEELKMRNIRTPVIVITASSDLTTAVNAMKLGAYDYVLKPIDAEKIKVVIKNAADKIKLEKEIIKLKSEISGKFRYDSLVAASKPMQEILGILEKVATTDATILIFGESGTGKGLLANAIHHNSQRVSHPFRTIDCSTIPSELLESELFGHEKGAFTGASVLKKGKFELSDKGTLFIDEIANLTFNAQAKLLKVLQEKQFERVGGNELIKVDTRIIAATNKDLRNMVANGSFREDLYFRLHVVPVYLPKLRERMEDIPFLIDHFLQKFAIEYNRTLSFDDSAMNFLMHYAWPGNIRQLENLLRRIVIISSNENVNADDLKAYFEHDGETAHVNYAAEQENIKMKPSENMPVSLEDMEKDAIIQSLKRNSFNISNAARDLKISRKTIHNKINRYNINISKEIV
jgi:DNA-binding NtrC family response regulator